MTAKASHPTPAQVASGDADLYAFALSIADKVQAITTSLQKKNLPQPSLGPNAALPDFAPSDEVEIQNLRRDVVADAKLLADVLTGPRRLLQEHCVAHNHYAWTMHAVYAYDIPRHVPVDGSISFAELSKACGLEEDKLTRILRFVMGFHLFAEPEPGKVSHSALSKLLATEQMSMDFLGHCVEDVLPACFSQVAAMKRHSSSDAVSSSILDCGFSHHFSDGKKALFEVFAEEPWRVKRMAGAMASTNADGAHIGVGELFAGFDWRSLGEVQVVDVGGSSGVTAIPLLRHAPNIAKITVQDLPEVIAEAQSKPKPDDVAPRLDFEVGDFFQPQQITDADVYYLRHILHDWPLDKAVDILRNQVQSIRVGARLVINDAVVVQSSENPYASMIARAADLQMMVAANARERTLEEWKAMVAEAVGEALVLESVVGNVLVFRKV